MNSAFDYFLKKEIPSVILCTPNKVPVASLGAGYNIKNTLRFNAMSSLELDFPKSIDKGATTLEAYDLIKNKMLILIDGVGYYIITECPENFTGATPIKHITCSSLESELLSRRLVKFSGTFNFYNSSEPKGTLLQIVIDLFPGWSIGTIDSSLENMYRTFESSNSTIYKFLTTDVSTAYSCTFTFDSFNKTISATLISNMTETTGTYISFNNISKSVELTEYSDEICTALYCYGKDMLDIDSVNPLGKNVIYNFDYYKTTEWMTQDLIDAINAWEEKIDNSQTEYSEKMADLLTANAELTTLKSELEELEAQLAGIVITYETELAQKLDTTQTMQDMEEQYIFIGDKNSEISIKQNTIDGLNSDIRKIVNDLQFTTKECLKNFLMDSSNVLSEVNFVNGSWKTTYAITSTNPMLNVVLLGELTPEILDNLTALNDATTMLNGRINLSIGNYPISDTEIGIIETYMNDVIRYIDELIILLSVLIPDTEEIRRLKTAREKINSYYTIMDYTSNFSEEQNIKLQSFIYENTYTNENIILTDIMTVEEIQGQAQILYNQGVSVLQRMSLPRFELSGDFVNYLALPEFSEFTESMDLGKIATIEIDDDRTVQAALLEIEVTYDNPSSFNMVLSNRIRLNNSNFIFADMFGKSSEDSSGVSGITGGNSPTIYSSISASSPSTNILNLSNAQISALGYLSFGVKPPKIFGNYQGIWLGYQDGAKVSLYSNENNYLQWDGTKLLIKGENFTLDSEGNITANNADLSGSITALSGSIGGWAIMDNYLYAGSGSTKVGLDSSGNYPVFYAGSDDPDNAPFRVYNDGRFVATAGSITGSIVAVSGSIGSWTITSSSLVSGKMALNGETPFIKMGDAVDYLEGIGMFMGFTSASGGKYVFHIGNPTGDFFASDGANLNIAGDWIAGWTAGSSSLSTGTGANTVSISSDGGEIPAFSAGAEEFAIAPFRVYGDGRLYATSASIAGSIIATSGSIGNWKLVSGSLVSSDNKIHINATGSYAFFSNDTFYVTHDGKLYATSASISGSLHAEYGDIAGWVITSNSIVSPNNETGMVSNGDYAFFAGDTNPTNAEFSVTHDGKIYASSGSIGGNLLGTDFISSEEFVSGLLGKGWKISSDGKAEFQDIIARGKIRTSVFEKDTISAVNGIVLISKADVLAENMTAGGSMVVITGETTFEVDEVLRIKDGADDEWMLVTEITSASAYGVTRDLVGEYSGTNPTWAKGTAIVSMGNGGTNKTGFILLDSSSASPVMDVYGRDSTTYDDYTLHGRIGWLGGITDNELGLSEDDIWGLYADNGYLKGTVVASSGSIGDWQISNGKIVSDSGSIILSGNPPYIALGTPPPTSASIGTGLWIDENGLYSLGNDVLQIKIDSETGIFYGGNEEVSISSSGININNLRDAISFYDNGYKIGSLYSSFISGSENRFLSLESHNTLSENLVTNGSFASGSSPWELQIFYPTPPGSSEIGANVINHETYGNCLRFFDTDYTVNLFDAEVYQDIVVSEKSTYYFLTNFISDNISGPVIQYMGITIRCYNSSDALLKTIYKTYEIPLGDLEWKKAEGYFYTPSSTSYVRISLTYMAAGNDWNAGIFKTAELHQVIEYGAIEIGTTDITLSSPEYIFDMGEANFNNGVFVSGSMVVDNSFKGGDISTNITVDAGLSKVIINGETLLTYVDNMSIGSVFNEAYVVLSGSMVISGSLSSGSISVIGKESISGSLVVSGSLSVGQNTNILGTLTSNLQSTFSGNQQAIGNVSIGEIITASLVTSGSNTFGDACYINTAGSAIIASASTVATCPALIMAIATNGSGVVGNYAYPGSVLRNDDWSWITGSPVYLSIVGKSGETLTQSRPAESNNVVQIIGMPIKSNVLYFNPQLTIVEVA